MKYVHGQTAPRPTHDELQAEMDRLKTEEDLYRGLIMQQARLTHARDYFQRPMIRESAAERVRKEATARYAYDPDECRDRLNVAAREAFPCDHKEMS